MSSDLIEYLDRRIKQLLTEGKPDSEIVQQLKAVGGHKQVVRLLSTIRTSK